MKLVCRALLNLQVDMERKDRIDAFGGTALLVFSLLLGLNQVLIKIVNAGFDPVFQAGLRSACALLPVLLYAWMRKKKLSISDGSFGPGLICGMIFAVEFLFLFKAIELTTVARASILFYTMPFWVTVGAHFLIQGERLTLVRLVGLGLAILGVAVALGDGGDGTGPSSLSGDLYAILGAIAWAALALMIRLSKLNRSTPEMQLIYQLIVSAIILIPLSAFLGDMVRDVTPMILGIFAFQVVIIVSIGFVVWFWILSIYPTSDMASYGFLAPVFGVFFGWLILDETISYSIVASLILVSIGIVLVNRKRAAKPVMA